MSKFNSLKDKLLASIEIVDGPLASPCWRWTRAKFANGYGNLWWEGVNIRAHRASYEVHYGPISAGMMVLHKCDIRACICPDHLTLGSHLENMQDKVRKKRHAFGERNGKITEEQALEVKRRLAKGISMSIIAYGTGVSYDTVRSIKSGASWSWLPARPSWRRL
jgi:hypothetical protein